MEELRLKLISTINESGLPLEAIVFIVRDVYRDVNETFQRMSEEVKNASSEKNNNNEEGEE